MFHVKLLAQSRVALQIIEIGQPRVVSVFDKFEYPVDGLVGSFSKVLVRLVWFSCSRCSKTTSKRNESKRRVVAIASFVSKYYLKS